ncbi:aromatic ring-hydroxylating dioxygenase subunit alpha [Pigmentiphaga sp. H8]|uniref:aromatic ring-hydroxylating dioxygenase subunit alpha n=1 Tax=Pigmentiphaga sp. H8 TaxID=2488560 RepID=UPI000F59B735|nr:aromatic ring-hydroxylating dioxygenase subunit alpha [Pigmentiphaga sp. H8]AZG11263.1 aromatic ring-hydroxylating dioxygenase subunit alpha [Pigmentiphaga sp. H8]
MFLRNTWYMAGWSGEIEGRMLARRIADTPLVFYRREDGRPAALHDRCPHRFAPLSRGRVDGGVVECGYHGLRFDGSGKCVGNPHGDGRIPLAAEVRAFPAVERYTLLWVWLGEPALADPSAIPDFSFLDDPARRRVDGYLHVRANYLLETDNLLDLSHTQFVHANFHSSEAILKGRHEVRQDGRTVHSNLWCPDGEASPMFAKRLPGYDGRSPVDQWLDMRWDPPCLLRLDTGVTPAGRPREEGGQSFTAHIVTPETETSTHYFFAHSRNFRVADEEMDQAIAQWQQVGFGEQDKPMLEAVQQAMGTADLMSLKPVLLPIDTAAVRARRVVRQLLEEEADGGAPAAVRAGGA